MKISFDLDDTLIPTSVNFETEKRNIIQRLFGIEKLRKGTKTLFKEIEKNNEIYIYTTSFRTISRIYLMFLSYGIFPKKVINQNIHKRNVNKSVSKYPPEFGIDIHVDDSEGVKIEGERFGFKTIIISKEDKNWGENILKYLKYN